MSSMTDDNINYDDNDDNNYDDNNNNDGDINDIDADDIENAAQNHKYNNINNINNNNSNNNNNNNNSSNNDNGDMEDSKVPEFPALTAKQLNNGDSEYQRIPVPPHRYTPLKTSWMDIYQPIVEHMKLQIRFNPKIRCVELRTSEKTESATAIQKSADFVRAFCLGFDIRDGIALLRLDDLYIDSFEIKDVKTLNGEHLSRAIGRIAGQAGKTKYTIENATKTRIVLADQHIHILGSYSNIAVAKSAIVKLIMGSAPGKVYTQMRAVANRQKERF